MSRRAVPAGAGGRDHDPMDASDRQDWMLMQRVGHGDEAAMSELYDRFVGLVYKASRQVLASRAESEDAVQETFVRLWQTADRFDPNRAKLVTWVMLITRRHLIDRLRRKGARPEQLGLDSAVDFLGPSVPAPTDVGGEHDVEILRRRVAELPELQRVVIERTYIQGFTLREVSEQLGAPLGTIKSALSRGLARLRDRMGSNNKMSGSEPTG
jgi:RNA polymerase sigma-70 factor (ECF subfamily)